MSSPVYVVGYVLVFERVCESVSGCVSEVEWLLRIPTICPTVDDRVSLFLLSPINRFRLREKEGKSFEHIVQTKIEKNHFQRGRKKH